jgi:EmrB/QacA subfamily drug resistance transporter
MHERRTNRRLTVAALMLGLFMAAMEMTVVSTAMPTVVGELGGLAHYGWVFTVYMLASTVMVPIFGKLADLRGRKPVLLFGIALFLVGSAASGLARSMEMLIAFRAIQGLGAGAMQPIALTIIGDIFDVRERGRVQGFFGAVWGVAGLAGPLVGAWIVHALSWRWVFYVNVPFGILCAGLLAVAFHERPPSAAPRFDVAGAALMAASTTVLLVAGGTAWWAVALPAAIVLAALFVRVELRAADPIFPVALFRRPLLAVASIVGTLMGGAMLATVTYVPLFVQGVQGRTPEQAGLAITPMVVAWPLASAIGGRLLPRTGHRMLVVLGLATTAVAAVLLAMLLTPGASDAVPRTTSALFGFGMGFANVALIIAVQSSVAWDQRGVATASTMFFRTIGGALAVAATGRVIASAVGEGSAEAISSFLGPEHGRGMAAARLAELSGALVGGLHVVFWTIAAMAIGAFLASLALPGARAAERPGASGSPDGAPSSS